MHAVLDGEATPDEARGSSAILARDPAARAEFDELQRLFDELPACPRRIPAGGTRRLGDGAAFATSGAGGESLANLSRSHV